MNIGKIGVWTSYRAFGVERAGEAAKVAEQLGYGALWVGGSPHVPDIRPVLNLWINDPGETAGADAALRADFPGRFMLGIGIGHPEATSDYRRPLASMRAFLDGLDASPTPPPTDERCLAALGPKMLALAGERTAGAHTYFVPVEHTRSARERLGPGKLLAPELACVIETEPARAKAVARDYAKLYLGLRNYTQNLLDFGFTVDDLADGGSDRLIDAVIPQGSAEQIAAVEGFDRGPYAGPVGWVDATGDGEWVIGIRSASIAGSVIFYVVTCAVSWLFDPGYPKSFAGLIQAVTVGLPQYGATPSWMFFRNSVVSDLLFTGLFILCFHLGHATEPARVASAQPRTI